MLQYHTHLEVTNLFSLIAMRLACGNDGVGGRESVDSCTMGEVESLGMVELVCVGRLLKMGCGPFPIPVCEFLGGGETMGAE